MFGELHDPRQYARVLLTGVVVVQSRLCVQPGLLNIFGLEAWRGVEAVVRV